MGRAWLSESVRLTPSDFWLLLKKRHGGDGARARFQELVRRIATDEARARGMAAFSPGAPDDGIDCLVYGNKDAKIVWQAKYIFDGNSLVAKCKESILSLAKSKPSNLTTWILAAPMGVTGPTKRKIEKLVGLHLGSKVQPQFVGAAEMLDGVLNLGTTTCREHFGSETFPLLRGYGLHVASAAVLVSLLAISLLGPSWPIASDLLVLPRDFDPPDLRRIALTQPATEKNFALADKLKELESLGYSPLTAGTAKLASLMGEHWAIAIEESLPAILEYKSSPSGQQCATFQRGLERLRDTNWFARRLALLIVGVEDLGRRVSKYGLTCQAISTGDLRTLAAMSLIAEHDRQRCVNSPYRGVECSGRSAADLLGTSNWEVIMSLLDSPTALSMHHEMGTIRFGACDFTQRHIRLGAEGDDLELDTTFELQGNTPPLFACDLVSWSQKPREQGTPPPRTFGLMLTPGDKLVAYRFDNGRIAGVTVGDGTRGEHTLKILFGPQAGEISLRNGAVAPMETLPVVPDLKCEGGVFLAPNLFPDSSGYGDDAALFALAECTSPASAWSPGEQAPVFCPTNMPAMSAAGMDLWDGTEDVAGEIEVTHPDAGRTMLPAEGQLIELEGGGRLEIRKRFGGVPTEGVLSFLARADNDCRIFAAGYAADEALQVSTATTRYSIHTPAFGSVVLTAECAGRRPIELSMMQWELGRRTASPVLQPGPIPRRCRKRQIANTELLAPTEDWPALIPSMH